MNTENVKSANSVTGVGAGLVVGQIPRQSKHELLVASIIGLYASLANLRLLRSEITNEPETATNPLSEPITSLKEILNSGPQEINEVNASINSIIDDLREILL